MHESAQLDRPARKRLLRNCKSRMPGSPGKDRLKAVHVATPKTASGSQRGTATVCCREELAGYRSGSPGGESWCRLAAPQQAWEGDGPAHAGIDRGNARGISKGRERIDGGIPFASQSHHYPNLLFCCPLRGLRCGLEPRWITVGSGIKVPQDSVNCQQFTRKE